MNLVSYARTSTDDKGQNPDRQHDEARAWADRHGYMIVGYVTDEGASAGKTVPFDRPGFQDAIQKAHRLGADALILEQPDRLTRLDSDAFGWTRHELKTRHKLGVLFSCFDPDMQDTMLGRLMAALKVEQGHEWHKAHGPRVKSGMMVAKLAGKHIGRPPKLSDEERRKALKLHEQGVSLSGIAHRISRDRGAFELRDPQAQRRRMVSRRTITRLVMEADT